MIAEKIEKTIVTLNLFQGLVARSREMLNLVQHDRRGKGFTLVELLIYMGILIIFIGTLSVLFSTSVNVQLESQDITSAEQDGRYLLTKLTYDIHRADSISTPNAIGGSASSLIISVDGNNYTYALDGNGNMSHTNNLGTFQLNSHDTVLSSLNFTRLGNVGGVEDTVLVSFELDSRVETVPPGEPKDFSTVISLRRQ